MRKSVKKDLLEFVNNFIQVHSEIANAITSKDIAKAQAMLGECQEFALSMGDIIEQSEGERFATIPILEDYCETLFVIYGSLEAQTVSADDAEQKLNDSIGTIKESIEEDIPVAKEIVFFPYKSSMWDSLESIYKAAKSDPNADVYCVPIPYYDRNQDGSLGAMHYEGNTFPSDVEITDWREYDYVLNKPDVAYLHNPYDDQNLVTSVHPLFYTDKIKKFTKCLVYVPYFSTSGSMSEYQRSCPVYYNADYIVIQAEKYRKFYDEKLLDKKFLVYGSPKFDRVINVCANPPEPPADWKAKMEGKTTYFYNTSLNGMLNNTRIFFDKMRYVFKVFKANPQACLIWRPHPLFESTLESMRPMFLEDYRNLREAFISEGYGIYDDTPDITNTIAVSDVYVGDDATSVTSLFGIVGKPIFSLNNLINEFPGKEDWKSDFIKYGFNYYNPDTQWIIAKDDRLFVADKTDSHHYHFAGKLHEGMGGDYYQCVKEIDGVKYICPANAQNILVTTDGITYRTIELEKRIEQRGAFVQACVYKHKLILIPLNYGRVVVYDTKKDKVCYYDQYATVHVRETNLGKRIGMATVYKDLLIIASPEDDVMRIQNLETGKIELLRLTNDDTSGTISMMVDGDDIWMLPHHGSTVRKWNPVVGTLDRYEIFPDEVKCGDPYTRYYVDENPFGGIMITDQFVYVVNLWCDVAARIDKKTGSISRWNINIPVDRVSSYFWPLRGFGVVRKSETGYILFSNQDRKMYDFNPDTGEYTAIPITFDYDECKATEPGFSEGNQWMQFKCNESAWNSLEDLLKGNITGNQFDRQKQLDAFRAINASPDGDCGIKVHNHIMDVISNR